MLNVNFSARPKGEAEAYIDLLECGLSAETKILKGDGSASSPWLQEIRICAEKAFEGVIRIAFSVEGAAPRFFLPGFMYGTNRGESPLVVASKCPRIREKEELPASPWWMVRSDRLSHPAAFAYANNRMVGISASPYYVCKDGERVQWKSGTGMKNCKGNIVETCAGECAEGYAEKDAGKITEANNKSDMDFHQYTGFGCAINPSELIYTLGYENAPWFFLESHHVFPRAEMGANSFTLAAGEEITVYVHGFDIPAEDERALHDVLKWVYNFYHEAPLKKCSVKETIEMIAGAVKEDAWLADKHMYSCFVFDKEDGFEYRLLPSIAWTNGLASALPMLLSALRLKDEDMRLQAIECIDHIVQNCMNEKNDLPYMLEEDGVWSNHGWWYDGLRTPGHAAYLIGQCAYLTLKAYAWEKQEKEMEHKEWMDFAARIIARTEQSRNSDGEYPYVLSEKTGAGLEYDSFSGAWCMAAAVYHAYLTGDRKYVEGMLKSEKWYHETYICHQECYGGPLDIDKNIDSEGILAYIRAVHYLHEITGEDYLLDHMKDALYYEFTFKFCYNSPVKVPPLSETNWSSCGGSITSVTNPHVHPMSSSIMDEMYYYLKNREDEYIRRRLEDTIVWSCQCHNTFDKEFGYGKVGWMSERFCHSEGLLSERYADGRPASTWFALMPWAAGSLLEGLAGEAWDDWGDK